MASGTGSSTRKKTVLFKSLRQRERFKKNFDLFLLMLPALLMLFLFNYLPMGGILIAFKNYRPIMGIFQSPWNNFKNFEFIFRSEQFFRAVYHTILYNLSFILLETFLAIAIAVLLFEIRSTLPIKIYQTVLLMPYFLSWVVVSIVLYGFLSTRGGFFNQIVKSMGAKPISWYNFPQAWPFILPTMYLWHRVGYTTLIYYAGLMGINPQLYEAADLDGANRLRKTFSITIPEIMPVISILIILALGRILFADFGLFYLLTLQSGPLIKTTDVINWYTFRALFHVHDYGMAAAAGLFQSLIGFLLIIVTNKVADVLSKKEYGIY